MIYVHIWLIGLCVCPLYVQSLFTDPYFQEITCWFFTMCNWYFDSSLVNLFSVVMILFFIFESPKLKLKFLKWDFWQNIAFPGIEVVDQSNVYDQNTLNPKH